MDSEQEIRPPARRTHRLTLDSEEEERRQQQRRKQEQQYERQREERRKRKQEKKRIREERERQAELKAKKQAEERMKQVQKYNDPAKLFQMDSDSSVNFKRIARKIKIMYPQFNKKSRRYQSEDSDSDNSEEDSEGSEQSSSHKQKKTKKIAKKKHDDDSPAHPKKPKNKGTVKVQQEMTRKDSLVHQIARRWWYAIPDWPPADFQYEKQLKKHGYRIVKSCEFRLVDDVKDGLAKVTQLQGYKGVYRSKYKLIDIRPKQTTPSINYFYSLSEVELARLVKKALQEQIKQLKGVEFVQSGEKELLLDLEKQLASCK